MEERYSGRGGRGRMCYPNYQTYLLILFENENNVEELTT